MTSLIVIVAAGVAWYVWSSSVSPGGQDFTLAAPSGVTIRTGIPTSVTINVTAVNGFNGLVQLTATPTSPNGLTTKISPSNVTGSGTATLTISATQNDTYSVIVTGTSGGLVHSITPRVATPVYATLATSKGNVTVELYRALTPQTVGDFVNLANTRFYNNLVWHRIKAGFVIQTGDPNTRNGGGDRTTWGQGTSQPIPFEYDPSLHNTVGYLGMASSAPKAGGSCQFYVNLVDNRTPLDGNYAVFGKVISGMNAVNALAALPTTTQYSNAEAPQPVNPADAMLISVTIS